MLIGLRCVLPMWRFSMQGGPEPQLYRSHLYLLIISIAEIRQQRCEGSPRAALRHEGEWMNHNMNSTVTPVHGRTNANWNSSSSSLFSASRNNYLQMQLQSKVSSYYELALACERPNANCSFSPFSSFIHYRQAWITDVNCDGKEKVKIINSRQQSKYYCH